MTCQQTDLPEPQREKINKPSSLLKQPPSPIRHFLVHPALGFWVYFPAAEFALDGVEAWFCVNWDVEIRRYPQLLKIERGGGRGGDVPLSP